MIRDPSDGSVKPNSSTAKPNSVSAKANSASNWGLRSLDKPERKPKPAPTADELRAHYAKHNLGFQPKEEGQ